MKACQNTFHRDISTVCAVMPECSVRVCLVHVLYVTKVKRVVIHLTEVCPGLSL